MKTWLLPIRILIYCLVLLALGAGFSWNGLDPFLWATDIRNFSLLFLTGWLTTYLISKLEWGTFSRPEHRIITSLILFLLFDSLAPWWIFAVLGAITELVQRLLRTPGGPLFNPAATGALVMSFFGFYPSWWGTNFSPRVPIIAEGTSIALFITLPIALYVVYKYKKYWVSLSTVITFSIAYSLLLGESPLFIVLDGTLIFFLLIMAVEPKTSPNTTREQIIFGSLVGALIPLGIYFHWLEAYTLALLIGNLYTKRKFLLGLFSSQSPISPPSSPSAV